MFDLLFPSYCVNCSKPGEYLCTTCKKKLINTLPECYVCRRISNTYITHNDCNRFNVDSLFVGWQYNSVAKKILSQFKYRYAFKLSEILSTLLIQRLTNTNFLDSLSKDSIFIPVPIHKSHSKVRGFNQSSLISNQITKKLGYELRDDIVVRVGSSQHQSTSDLKKRIRLGDVFRLKEEIVNKDIVIVDDVATTGTTINMMAKSLAGNKIKAIVLFRGSRPRQ